MKYRMLLLLAIAALTLTATAYAHHSFAAVYNVKETVKLEGNLVQFVFRNPHSFVFIEAPDPDGKTQRWSLEWGGAAQLAGQHDGRAHQPDFARPVNGDGRRRGVPCVLGVVHSWLSRQSER